jgi:hypothetical protein
MCSEMKISTEALTSFGDVESKKPQYAAVYVKNYSDIDKGGCIDKSDAGYEFSIGRNRNQSTKMKR